MTNWFVNPRPKPEAKACLFFFPYAGGSPAVFTPWLAQLPATVEGWVAHLPGRGSRHLEPACKRLSPLVQALSQAIEPLLDRPYALFGHSLGALIAFELARHLRKHHLPQPDTLFISAGRAAHLPDPHPPIHALPEVEFIKVLKELNGLSPELLKEPEVMNVLLPVLRADFEAFETYNYKAEPPLDCRIVAFGGVDDARLDCKELEAWASQTSSSFQSAYFPGDHFFINTARESIIASITAEIKVS